MYSMEYDSLDRDTGVVGADGDKIIYVCQQFIKYSCMANVIRLEMHGQPFIIDGPNIDFAECLKCEYPENYILLQEDYPGGYYKIIYINTMNSEYRYDPPVDDKFNYQKAIYHDNKLYKVDYTLVGSYSNDAIGDGLVNSIIRFSRANTLKIGNPRGSEPMIFGNIPISKVRLLNHAGFKNFLPN